jgi:hypothetical protein
MANAAKAQAKVSKGARALAAWAKKNGYASFAAAGRALDVPWHRYRRWETGECVPLVTDAVMLEKKCGIPTSAWFE